MCDRAGTGRGAPGGLLTPPWPRARPRGHGRQLGGPCSADRQGWLPRAQERLRGLCGRVRAASRLGPAAGRQAVGAQHDSPSLCPPAARGVGVRAGVLTGPHRVPPRAGSVTGRAVTRAEPSAALSSSPYLKAAGQRVHLRRPRPGPDSNAVDISWRPVPPRGQGPKSPGLPGAGSELGGPSYWAGTGHPLP